MNIQKQRFIDAGRWMMIPREKLPDNLQSADKNRSGVIDSPEEFEALFDLITVGARDEVLLQTISGLMSQIEVNDSESLAGRKLEQVSQLQAVFNGLGQIVRTSGTSAGTKAIQEALNKISEKLSDFPKCYVGIADGKFGQKTENGIRFFQAVHHDLNVTGSADDKTLMMLDDVLSSARTIIVNEIQVIDPGSLRMIIYNDRFGKDCVLTFDDGPDLDSIKVLDALKSANVTGVTFFVQGINVKKFPQILRRMVDEGHVLGNHTYDHPDLTKLNANDVVKQLQMCQEAVNNALGREYPLKQMRPPYGAINNKVRDLLNSHGFEVMLWQVDSNDWRTENRKNPQNIVHNVFLGDAPVTKGRGGLILFHDIHPSTGEILPEVIRRLKMEGMVLTTAQALLDRKYYSA